MCGIAGIVGLLPFDRSAEIAAMSDAIAHRGPDGSGFISLQPGRRDRTAPTAVPQSKPAQVWLGHRRLRIIDPSGSEQPLCNEDGRVWVTFNGEIYNYHSLRDELVRRGHHLRENGDTEVLVHLWEEHGTGMLDYLKGMFALAVYDVASATLFLARDRYGKKPLYYFHHENGLSFASELQALWQCREFPDDSLDSVAVAQYFRYGYIPAPRTVYDRVSCLSPGHYMLYRHGNISVHRYWHPRVASHVNEVDYHELEAEFDRAVATRLQSDVPVGALLSGGIDSGLTVASMVRQMEEPLQTFTLSSSYPSQDESDDARAIARHLNTRHQSFEVLADIPSTASLLARHHGQPFADTSSIASYSVFKQIDRQATVILTGDGGDELFAGYERYRNYRYFRALSVVPLKMRNLLGRNLPGRHWLPELDRLADLLLRFRPLPAYGENISSLWHTDFRRLGFQQDFSLALDQESQQTIDCFTSYYNESDSRNPIERWIEADQRSYLADDILTKVDTASMAASLECRTPFLDQNVAELANGIGIRQKLRGPRSKPILRKLARRRLPIRITRLPKSGFTVPVSQWLRDSLTDWSHALLFDDITHWEPWLDPAFVRHLWKEHRSRRADHAQRIWTVIALTLWSKSNRARI